MMTERTTNSRTIQTQRFGQLDVPEHRVVTMEKPVLGFEQCREFVALKTGDMHPFVWFQALTEPEIAFLMINPKLLYADYTIDINRREVEDIEITDSTHVEIFAIVTVGSSLKVSTVNLQGPIVINTKTRKAKQLVLANSHYSVAAPLAGAEAEDGQRTRTGAMSSSPVNA